MDNKDKKGKDIKLKVIGIELQYLEKDNKNEFGVVFSHAGEQYPYNFIVKIITKEI